MSSDEERELVLQFNVKFRGKTDQLIVPVQGGEEPNILCVKDSIVAWFEESVDPRRIWVVFKGKELHDDVLVRDAGIEEFSVLYAGVKSSPPNEPAGPTEPILFPAKTEPERTSARANTSNPFAQLVAHNPDMMLELLQMNPKVKAMMEKDPNIRHALSDPKTLQEILQTGSNPKMYQEVMRGHDRALANIENMPGGFQALQQFYANGVASLEEGAGEVNVKSREYEGHKVRNTDPMPNPWNPEGRAPASSSPNLWMLSMMSNFDLGSGTERGQQGDTGRASGGFALPRSVPIWDGAADAPSDISQPTSLPEILASPPAASPVADFDVGVYEARFQEQLKSLEEMGFGDTRENIRALLLTGGNVDLAIERLLGKPG